MNHNRITIKKAKLSTVNCQLSILLLLAVAASCGTDDTDDNSTPVDTTVPVMGVTIPPTLTLTVGDGGGSLTAIIIPDNATDQTVTWDIVPSGIITITDNGAVTALKEGEATVTATAGGKTASSKVTVKPAAVPVTDVTLTPATQTLTIGASGLLTATLTPDNATDQKVTWNVEPPDVIIFIEGAIIAMKEGEATVTATAGGKTASATVTVKPVNVPVTDITLAPATQTLAVGETGQLTATLTPDNTTDKKITWEVEPAGIITITGNGAVTTLKALKEGEATVTVTAGDKTASATVTVKPLITAATFPDVNFRIYVMGTFDTNDDGKISTAEAAAVRTIDCSTKKITSLEGIEAFTAVTHLYCYDNKLTTLDVSKNTALTVLSCHTNQLEAAALDALFNTLPTATTTATVRIGDNPGTDACNQEIAKDKGWTVDVIMVND